jgi:NAD(P)-dependent dehydrogenase (short-subunit alcohol dehydrogenase family)
MPASRRVAIVANGNFYVGPPLALLLAQRGYDIVIGDPRAGLVAELEAHGAAVEAVSRVADLGDPDSSARLVQAALDRFGRLDSACAFSGQIVNGRFLKSTVEDLRTVLYGCVEAPYQFLKAVVPPMVDAGDGQVLIITSAAGAKPTRGAALYSSARAAANMMVRNVAEEVAAKNVQVNSLGTNFMDFPEFRRATGADDPAVRAKVESMVPMGRLGTVEECAAMCAVFLDGTSRFTTGQFVGYAGGWV